MTIDISQFYQVFFDEAGRAARREGAAAAGRRYRRAGRRRPERDLPHRPLDQGRRLDLRPERHERSDPRAGVAARPHPQGRDGAHRRSTSTPSWPPRTSSRCSSTATATAPPVDQEAVANVRMMLHELSEGVIVADAPADRCRPSCTPTPEAAGQRRRRAPLQDRAAGHPAARRQRAGRRTRPAGPRVGHAAGRRAARR